jgi:hypothetical protein
MVLLAEAGAILVLSAAAYIMSLKDKSSLDKLREHEQDLKNDDVGKN